MRILYRLVQEVPAELWEEKIEQERLSDEAEAAAGHPLPRRYRAMFGAESSHIRVSEREYESFVEFAKGMEDFMNPENEYHDSLHNMEARRRQFITWEREELYYVDSGEPVPAWMQKTAALLKGRRAGTGSA